MNAGILATWLPGVQVVMQLKDRGSGFAGEHAEEYSLEPVYDASRGATHENVLTF